jgi:hypothetical protein
MPACSSGSACDGRPPDLFVARLGREEAQDPRAPGAARQPVARFEEQRAQIVAAHQREREEG